MTNSLGTEFEIQDPNLTLTPRQREVLVWVVEGKENEAIGMLMGITLGTVKLHMMSLLRRFEAPNRQLLVSRGWKEGLVKARHLAIGLLILGSAMPGASDQPVTVRTPRIARARVASRRSADECSLMPTHLDDLLIGDREAA